MTDDNATPTPLEKLLDAVENVINGASKIALMTEVGMMDGVSVTAHQIQELYDTYNRYVNPSNPENCADD